MRKSNFDFKTRSHKVLPPHKQPPKEPEEIVLTSSEEELGVTLSAPYDLACLAAEIMGGGATPRSSLSPPWPEPEVKKQISAPSYLQSLAENDLPPFGKPGKEPRPAILTGRNTMVTPMDVVELVAASVENPEDGLEKAIQALLLRVKIVDKENRTENEFLTELLKETVSYSAQRNFGSLKLSMLISIYLSTHSYFKWYFWNSPKAVWQFFHEVLLRHTVEDAPYSVEYFKPGECFDIMTHFHTIYMNNLPLIHLCTFGAHRLNLCWPFTPTKK